MKKWPSFVLGGVFIIVSVIGFLIGQIIIGVFFGIAGLSCVLAPFLMKKSYNR